jgi:hypothetical protein
MKRYVVRKDVWLDEKQPEAPHDQIGYELPLNDYYSHPAYMKKKRKPKKSY